LEAHKEDLERISEGLAFRKPREKMVEMMCTLKGLTQAVMDPHVLSSDERVEKVKKILEEAKDKVEKLG